LHFVIIIFNYFVSRM